MGSINHESLPMSSIYDHPILFPLMRLPVITLALLYSVASAEDSPRQNALQGARQGTPEEESQGTLDPLVLMGRGDWAAWGERNINLESQRHRGTDGASMLAGVPGTAIVRNGSQTGIVQMRGLSGDRVKVSIDGMSISPACPNHMDPPMHYASAGSTTELMVTQGVTPVRYGGDHLAGVVRLLRPSPEFASTGEVLVSGELSGFYLGSHEAYGAGVEMSLGNEEGILSYRGGWSTANDLRFPGGRLRASGYDSQHNEIDVTLRTGNGYLVFDTGQTRTRDAGTPVLPMDMVQADSWHAGLRQVADLGYLQWENRVYVHSIDHLMDNFSIRHEPRMRMEAPSDSRDVGLASSIEMPLGEHIFRAGVDGHRNDFDAIQKQVISGNTRDMFADNRRQRIGVFAEWEQVWSDQWSGLFGIRGDYVETSAGRVASEFGPPPVAADAAAFNAGDREHDDLLVDLATTLAWDQNERTRYELSAGIKNRAPSLLERYLWTPLSASAGRADGRTYLGNPDLDPETSFQIAASVRHRAERWELAFAPFYHRVHDYIQGESIDRMDMAGKPVLQFENMDQAELFGAELAGRYLMAEHWELAAQLSYVRGRNKDTGDDLYRISPLHGLVDLAWQQGDWETHFEIDWAASQNDVSAFNDEESSSGYVLLHWRGMHRFKSGTRVEIGVENLLDEEYSAHLAGVNRVAGSDVAVGESIPGAGRFFYANLSWAF